MGSILDTVPSTCRIERTPRSTTTPAKRTTPAAGATTSSSTDAGRSMPRCPAEYSSAGRSNARLTSPRPSGHTQRATGAAACAAAGVFRGALTGTAWCAAECAGAGGSEGSTAGAAEVSAEGAAARDAANAAEAEWAGFFAVASSRPNDKAKTKTNRNTDRLDVPPAAHLVGAYTSPSGIARPVDLRPEGMRGRAYTCWAMLTSLAARATDRLPASRSVDDFRSRRFGRNGCQPAPTRPE
jgi:hypothetical protein